MKMAIEKPLEQAATNVTARVNAKLQHAIVIYRDGVQRAVKGLDMSNDSMDQVIDAYQTMGFQVRDFEKDFESHKSILRNEVLWKQHLVDYEKKDAELHALLESNASLKHKLEREIADLSQANKRIRGDIERLATTKTALRQLHIANPLLFGDVETAVKHINAEPAPRQLS